MSLRDEIEQIVVENLLCEKCGSTDILVKTGPESLIDKLSALISQEKSGVMLVSKCGWCEVRGKVSPDCKLCGGSGEITREFTKDELCEWAKNKMKAFENDPEYLKEQRNIERGEVEYLESHCPLCGHLWRQHDPADGMCDAGPTCKCGRDLIWMQIEIAKKSTECLEQ
jgi:hypothetical protein